MKDLRKGTKANHDNQYNEEPVFYCSRCLSLKVMDSEGILYCDECGNTEISQANIYDWENIYEAKYEDKFLNIRKNGRERS